jgi:methyl coenzyme M reductase subunit C-like uncharacterized protein (methanogenesis marker protein 7)
MRYPGGGTFVSRQDKIPVRQEGLPDAIPDAVVPRQRGRNVVEVVQEVVEDLRRDLAGAPPEVVLEVLLDRLTAALPGVTFNSDSMREHALSIAAGADG